MVSIECHSETLLPSLNIHFTAATERLAGLQGLSMMMWAFAKLDHTPSPKFSAGVLVRFNDSLEEFSAQVRYQHASVVGHVDS